MTTAIDVVELRKVKVRYRTRRSFFRHDHFTALDDVSFAVKKGETLGVIGSNGCGKSTLLRVLANIYGIDGGEINWNCRQVSLLSLSLGFDPELTGRDNAIISGMLLGGRRKEVVELLEEIIEFSELGDFIDKPIKTYSSGMRSRLLIDEVLGVGDAKFKHKAEDAMVGKINSEQTVVLVSHSMVQIDNLCDRVLWLDSGKTRMIGAPSRIINEYNRFLSEA
jgi:lipopolysaccharide transport system ATP-binding protein